MSERFTRKYGGKVNTTSCDPFDLCFTRGQIHRDYLSHYFRWCFLGKLVKRGSKILDVGAGKGLLAELLYRNMLKPEVYHALEVAEKYLPSLKRIEDLVSNNFPMTTFLWDIRETPWPTRDNFYDVVACFEVIEHFEPVHLPDVLNQISCAMVDGGRLLLSTPNYDGIHKAKNHIHEYHEDELWEYLERFFEIEAMYGTFMSLGRPSQAKKILTPAQFEVYNGLYPYYNSSILSIFFAPLHPSQSRNILWVCSK